jgi:hypothetical protein
MPDRNNKILARYEVRAGSELYMVIVYQSAAGALYGEYVAVPRESQPPIRVYDFTSRVVRDQDKEMSEIFALCVADIEAKSGATISILRI